MKILPPKNRFVWSNHLRQLQKLDGITHPRNRGGRSGVSNGSFEVTEASSLALG